MLSLLSLLVSSCSERREEFRQEDCRTGITEWWAEGPVRGGVTDITDYKLTLMLNLNWTWVMWVQECLLTQDQITHGSVSVADREIEAQFFLKKKKKGETKSSSEYFRVSAG